MVDIEELRAEIKTLIDQITDEHVLRSMIELLKLPSDKRTKFAPWMEGLGPDHVPSIEDVDRFLVEIGR